MDKDVRLYNTLSRKKEIFRPINPPQVGLYTCGPTVYLYAHLGNFRTFLFEDFLRRVLECNGYQVKHVMNITDVGHLTSDADTGEDKLEKSAQREGKTVWEIADFYTKVFLQDMERLNILKPNILPKATEHINEQIEFIRKLEKNGLTYQTSTGVYFDTESYEKKGYDYTVLTGQKLDEKIIGAREEVVTEPEKKTPVDFALWLFTVGSFAKHVMRWDSPWGEGFPGWHLECSVMSAKYLGQPFDIHTGGEDHVTIHHTNEIAQSVGAYDKPLANYWLHGKFMKIDGRRMGKSEGNLYLVTDLERHGFDPLSFRYLCLTTHYRQTLNFTWESLKAAQQSLQKLRRFLAKKQNNNSQSLRLSGSQEIDNIFAKRFLQATNDDLNLPQALAVTWELLKSNLAEKKKVATLLVFDQVLGFDLAKSLEEKVEIPTAVRTLVNKREKERQKGNWKKSDELREQIKKLCFTIEDTPQGPCILPPSSDF
ncbi:MAG: cysteine--tRNA ligase [Candidatus Cloacimonetes bacterium]|nr:cysteine--tRNA ligase [Candidatus Cloacimonadota bacterium]